MSVSAVREDEDVAAHLLAEDTRYGESVTLLRVSAALRGGEGKGGGVYNVPGVSMHEEDL